MSADNPPPTNEEREDEESTNFGVIFHRQDLNDPRQVRSIGFNRTNAINSTILSPTVSRPNNTLLTAARRNSSLESFVSPRMIDDYRNIFTNYLVNTLMSEVIRPTQPQESSAFWDPVKIGLNLLEAEKIEKLTEEEESCWICTEDKTQWRKLPCNDKHKICNDCFLTWFSENVKCPYCKLDLRTKITAE